MSANRKLNYEFINDIRAKYSNIDYCLMFRIYFYGNNHYDDIIALLNSADVGRDLGYTISMNEGVINLDVYIDANGDDVHMTDAEVFAVCSIIDDITALHWAF